MRIILFTVSQSVNVFAFNACVNITDDDTVDYRINASVNIAVNKACNSDLST